MLKLIVSAKWSFRYLVPCMQCQRLLLVNGDAQLAWNSIEAVHESFLRLLPAVRYLAHRLQECLLYAFTILALVQAVRHNPEAHECYNTTHVVQLKLVEAGW